MRAMEYWINELKGKSPKTKSEYLRYFSKFLDHLGVDAEELFAMQKDAIESEDLRDARIVALKLRNYLSAMGSEWSPSTLRMVVKSVKSFMQANCIPFDFRPSDSPAVHYNGARTMTPKQLKFIYNCTNARNLRSRSLIQLGKDSGLRASDISAMNVEDYLGAETIIRNGEVFKKFKPYKTIKTGLHAHPVIGPESIEAVDKYLNGRVKGPLFLDRKRGRMSVNAVKALLKRLCSNAGEKLSSHSLRKYHRVRLESEMPPDWVRRLQGKQASPYSNPQETGDLVEAYIKAYDRLRIFDADRVSEVEVEEMRKEQERLKEMVESLMIREHNISTVFLRLLEGGEIKPETLENFRKRALELMDRPKDFYKKSSKT